MSAYEFFTTSELKKDLELFKDAMNKKRIPAASLQSTIESIEAELDRREPAELVEAKCCANCANICDENTCYYINPGYETSVLDHLVCKHFIRG